VRNVCNSTWPVHSTIGGEKERLGRFAQQGRIGLTNGGFSPACEEDQSNNENNGQCTNDNVCDVG
jgi:hypothetical protein